MKRKKIIYPLTIKLGSRIFFTSVTITPYNVRLYGGARTIAVDIIDRFLPYVIYIKKDDIAKKYLLPNKILNLFVEKLPIKNNPLLLYAVSFYSLKNINTLLDKSIDDSTLVQRILSYAEKLLERIKANPGYKYTPLSANYMEVRGVYRKLAYLLYRFTFKFEKKSYVSITAKSIPIRNDIDEIRDNNVCKRYMYIRTKKGNIAVLDTFVFNPLTLPIIGKFLEFHKRFTGKLYKMDITNTKFSIPLHFIFKYMNLLYSTREILGTKIEQLLDDLVSFDEKYIEKYSKDLEESGNVNNMFDLIDVHSVLKYFPDDAIVALYLRYPDEKLFYSVYPVAPFMKVKDMSYLVKGDTVWIVRNKNEDKHVFITDSTFYYLFLVAAYARVSHTYIDKILFDLANAGFAKMYKMYSWEIVDFFERFYNWELSNDLIYKLFVTGFTVKPSWMEKSSVAIDFSNPRDSFKIFFSEKFWEKLENVGIKDNILYVVFSRKFMWRWDSMPEELKEEYSKTQEAIALI